MRWGFQLNMYMCPYMFQASRHLFLFAFPTKEVVMYSLLPPTQSLSGWGNNKRKRNRRRNQNTKSLNSASLIPLELSARLSQFLFSLLILFLLLSFLSYYSIVVARKKSEQQRKKKNHGANLERVGIIIIIWREKRKEKKTPPAVSLFLCVQYIYNNKKRELPVRCLPLM